VKVGSFLEARLESLDRNLRAEVREVIPSVDVGSRSFSVDACLIGDVKGVIPGMFARCEVAIGTEEALMVSQRAIKQIGQLDYLTVKTPTGAVNQLVTTAPSSAGQVRILSGLRAGDLYQEVTP
jgi:HlyD family secretion protein